MRLPFAYPAEVVLPPRRKSESVVLRGLADLMVPSVGGTDAPEALRLVRHDLPARYESIREAPVEVYRAFEGRLYTPLNYGERASVSAEDFQRDVLRPEAWSNGGRFAHSGAHAQANGAPSWSRDAYPLRSQIRYHDSSVLMALSWDELKDMDPKARVVSHGRDEAHAEAVEALSERILVVDGAVWTSNPSLEPHWYVHTDFNDSKVSIGFSLSPDRSLSYLSPFRLDRLDAATEYGRLVAERLGWPFEEALVEASVSRPDALRFDDGIGLASALMAVSDLDLSSEGLPEAARRAMDDLAAMGRPKGLSDAGRVLRSFESLVDADAPICRHRRSREVIVLAVERWRRFEAPRRPDLVALAQPDLDQGDVDALSF